MSTYRTTTLTNLLFLNPQNQSCKEKDGSLKEDLAWFGELEGFLGRETKILGTLGNRAVVDIAKESVSSS